MNKKHPIITICSSAAFYRQAIEVQDALRIKGFEVIVPKTANTMKASGDFDVSHYKTWFTNADDYENKSALMRAHFVEVAKSDAILVLNYEKHGIPNYIGGNVLMEMALAFYLKKPIFVLNSLPKQSPFEEEILGMQPVFLEGDLSKLKV